MKKKKVFLWATAVLMSSSLLSGCAAKVFEKELNVVFVNEGEIVNSGTITQFKNMKSPVLSDAYIPTDYRFLGWTCYAYDELDLSDANRFKTQYIYGGRMVHYMDVEKFASNSTIVCQSLIMHKDDIPTEYHYAVLAWYDKASTSGLTSNAMDTYTEMLSSHLTAEGVSDEDVSSVVVRGYSGNVGPTTGQIVYDNDVDIMIGWGSVSNITTTGSIPEEDILETVAFPVNYNGEIKNRYIHRLSDSEGALKLMEYLKSEETANFFNPR